MKKRLLRLCSIVLVISMVLGNLVSLAADDTESTETTEVTGMSFSENLKGIIDNPFESGTGVKTLEVTISLPETLPDGVTTYNGIIMGTCGDTSLPDLYFGIFDSGNGSNAYPYIYYYDSTMEKSYTAAFNYNFLSKKDFDKTHLTFVLDESESSTTTVFCYVDGEKIDLCDAYTQPTVSFSEPAGKYCVGGDYSTNQTRRWFKGEIYSIATYSDARTATEIQADMSGIDTSNENENLTAYYDLTTVDASTTLVNNASANDAKNTYGLNLLATWMGERRPALDEDNIAYSIALVGDTQIATEYDIKNNQANENGVVAGIYRWLLEYKEKKNIQFVVGLGDIVQGESVYSDDKTTVKDDDAKAAEWKYAMEQIQTLDDEIPYSLIRGNHDAQAQYKQYVTYEHYKDYVDGALDETMLNTWQELIVNDIKYLILSLDLGASDTELEWAEEVIKTHPNHNVIISTHGYLNDDGTTLDANDKYYPSQYPSADYPSDRNNGDEMWEDYFSKYDNVVMIVSGHIGSDDIIMSQATGDNGNTVAQLLVNPQDLDYKLIQNGGQPTGMICLLNFSADGKTVQVEQYSTAYDQWYMSTSQFEFELNVIEDANQKLLFNTQQMARTDVRPFAYKDYACATFSAQAIVNTGYTNVISYCAPSDGQIRIADMTVGFYGTIPSGGELEFAVTDANGKILTNKGNILTFDSENSLVTNLSIETQEVEKGESIYFVFHGSGATGTQLVQCNPKIEFSSDDGETWEVVSSETSGYRVPWPKDTTTWTNDTAVQGMGGFYYQYSDIYEKSDYSESNDRVVIHTRRMSDTVTTDGTTTPFIYNTVYTCTTKYSNIIAAAGYTNVISYEAKEAGKIWIDNLYVYCATTINATTGVVAEAEFALVDENGKILSNNGEVYSVKAQTTAEDARTTAENLAPVLFEVEAGERIYFVFHGITATPDMRCNANIQFCAEGETTWSCVSAYTTAGGVNTNSLRKPGSTSIADLSQGAGNFYYEYSETYDVTDKESEYIGLVWEELSNMDEYGAHSSFPYEQPNSGTKCMTRSGEIITSAGYTNVISYEVPETGIIYITGQSHGGMKVWIDNKSDAMQTEFAVVDETGKILTNSGQKYLVESNINGGTTAKSATKGLTFTKEVEAGEHIYFVFHGLAGDTQSLRCDAKIWLSTDNGVTWTHMNSDAPSAASVGLYSGKGYIDGTTEGTAATPALGQGVGGFYYQYATANTSDVDGVTIGTEEEGVVTIYEPVESKKEYCDKYITEVASDGTVSYIDLDMLNIKKQSKVNENSKIDVRYIASVDNLSYKTVGFVFSLSNTEPTIGGEKCSNKPLTKVYKRLLEDNGSRLAANIYADDGCSTTYGYAFEILNTPQDTTVYARAYVELSDGTIVYGEPRAVTTTETGTAD